MMLCFYLWLTLITCLEIKWMKYWFLITSFFHNGIHLLDLNKIFKGIQKLKKQSLEALAFKQDLFSLKTIYVDITSGHLIRCCFCLWSEGKQKHWNLLHSGHVYRTHVHTKLGRVILNGCSFDCLAGRR